MTTAAVVVEETLTEVAVIEEEVQALNSRNASRTPLDVTTDGAPIITDPDDAPLSVFHERAITEVNYNSKIIKREEREKERNG